MVLYLYILPYAVILLFVCLAAVCDIGSASFKYDMRRLLEILALPKAWYRRSLARRMFLGEELAVLDSDLESGIATNCFLPMQCNSNIQTHMHGNK